MKRQGGGLITNPNACLVKRGIFLKPILSFFGPKSVYGMD
jgi:hypothetical protein